MTVIWFCLLNRQAEEIIAKCLSQGHNNMTMAGFEPILYRSKIARVTGKPCCRQVFKKPSITKSTCSCVSINCL